MFFRLNLCCGQVFLFKSKFLPLFLGLLLGLPVRLTCLLRMLSSVIQI